MFVFRPMAIQRKNARRRWFGLSWKQKRRIWVVNAFQWDCSRLCHFHWIELMMQRWSAFVICRSVCVDLLSNAQSVCDHACAIASFAYFNLSSRYLYFNRNSWKFWRLIFECKNLFLAINDFRSFLNHCFLWLRFFRNICSAWMSFFCNESYSSIHWTIHLFSACLAGSVALTLFFFFDWSGLGRFCSGLDKPSEGISITLGSRYLFALSNIIKMQ